MTSSRAFASLLIVLIVGALGAGTYGAIHFGWFDGATKRAKTSTQTTAALVSAETASGASAAAYVQTMTAVAATLPESKQKAFLGSAGTIALSYLPAADPAKLLEAEKHKVAFLSGQLEVAQALTANALQGADKAKQDLARAISAKRASDMALEEAAAEARGANEDKFWLVCIAGACLALFAYVKLTHASPGALARIVTDLRSNAVETPAVAAVDGATTPLQQMMVKGNVWFNSKLAKLFS